MRCARAHGASPRALVAKAVFHDTIWWDGLGLGVHPRERISAGMERSLKEAASELGARIDGGRERRFPVLGLKGAANALMLREAASIIEQPLIVITPLASDAELSQFVPPVILRELRKKFPAAKT